MEIGFNTIGHLYDVFIKQIKDGGVLIKGIMGGDIVIISRLNLMLYATNTSGYFAKGRGTTTNFF